MRIWMWTLRRKKRWRRCCAWEAEAEAGQTGLPTRDGRQADRAASQVAVGRNGHETGEYEGMEEPLFMPGEPDEEELAALLEMEGDM